ncbi:zinc finger (MYND type) family protein [Actinidia rufa]|uniref:Zinc finger (MYND type) family protein n=1 Tax=Actinidia rufa TaxID=165716 RepID=A0A7J0FJ24_9ERIC|nr:zinc finger (MYND type) family protein [Actinidia rufa]
MSNGGVSLEKLTDLRITPLEDEEDDEPQGNGVGDIIDDDDDEEEEEQVPVTLGFVEKPKNRWSLLRQLFPSKAGGVPVYAPLPEKESAFHRTLFVFMCPSMVCLLQDQHEQWKRQPEKASRSVKIFRCQLARSNSFYSSDAPRCDGTDKPSGIGVASNTQWPEYEIINEDECEVDMEISEDNMYANSLTSAGTQMDEATKSLLDNFEGDGDRKSWASFQERISRAPDQVLRQNGASIQAFLLCLPILSSWHPSSSPSPLPQLHGDGIVNEKVENRFLVALSQTTRIHQKTAPSDEIADGQGLLHYLASLPCNTYASRTSPYLPSPLESLHASRNSLTPTTYPVTIHYNEDKTPPQILNPLTSTILSQHHSSPELKPAQPCLVDNLKNWYCRFEQAKPLWPMSSGRPSKTDIPTCSYCGGPRCLEFQILPQLLYYFGVKNDVDSLDWATIVVYACKASCEGSEPYKQEFGWVQLASQSAPVR